MIFVISKLPILFLGSLIHYQFYHITWFHLNVNLQTYMITHHIIKFYIDYPFHVYIFIYKK